MPRLATKTRRGPGRPKGSGTRTAAAATTTRTPRPALVPRTVQFHEFDAPDDELTVGYLRKLVAGIPRKVPDTFIVTFGDEYTRVSLDTVASNGAGTGNGAGEPPDDDEDDDEDEDDE